MTKDQTRRNILCMDLAELFTQLPKTDGATTELGRTARGMILEQIGQKLVELSALGLDWR